MRAERRLEERPSKDFRELFVCCMRASEEAAVYRASASQELIPHHSGRGWHLGVSASKTKSFLSKPPTCYVGISPIMIYASLTNGLSLGNY